MSQNGRPTMSGSEFRKIRKRLGLSMDVFALELGYEGSHKGNITTIKRFEKGNRPISLPVAKLAWMMSEHGVPTWPFHLEASPLQETES